MPCALLPHGDYTNEAKRTANVLAGGLLNCEWSPRPEETAKVLAKQQDKGVCLN